MTNSEHVEEALNVAMRHYARAIATGTPEELKAAFMACLGLWSAWKTLSEIEQEKSI